RALRAPAVATRETAPPAKPQPQAQPQPMAAAGPIPAQVVAMLQRLRSEIEKNCDYVGPAFAEEARRMHRGEADPHGIYGETTPEEAEALAEEGIEIASIPWVPRADG
ncbi:MAG: DUF1178 family protein, partial [Rhodospirillales bacterium]|nr:DUF1178 family protein [Rhodospirillales bacterium]